MVRLGLVLLLLALPAAAQEAAPPAVRLDVALPGGGVTALARVETFDVAAAGGKTARVSLVSYQVEGAAGRPVTFAFNGGPGAASVYLHLGALGPRVLATGADGRFLPPPATVASNPDTWLRFTDLVFVDPVGTGASGGADDDADHAFWSVTGDVHSLAELIRQWLARHNAWDRPKYLVGESYGGYRAALLAHRLQEAQSVPLNGLFLVSPVLEFELITPHRANVLPWALLLPSLAATARAHGRGAGHADQAAVESFALGEYLAGLAQIDPGGAGPAAALIDRVATLLGLEPAFVREQRGRITAGAFAGAFLQDRDRVVSIYDGALDWPAMRRRRPGMDPLLLASIGVLGEAMNAYLHNELRAPPARTFRVLHRETGRRWNWEGARGGPGPQDGASDELLTYLQTTPGGRVAVVHGVTDLVTPYMTSRWALAQLPLPPGHRDRATMHVLDGGHMMYFAPAMRADLARLAADFYARQAERPRP